MTGGELSDGDPLRRATEASEVSGGMRTAIPILLLGVLPCSSCVTSRSPDRWQGSQVFMLSAEAGFEWQTLELKDGLFRYWFASDVVHEDAPEYPIEGTYHVSGDVI